MKLNIIVRVCISCQPLSQAFEIKKKFTMKLAIFATIIATTAAFGINKADLGKVRFEDLTKMTS
jgi:hypothetical protein